MKNWNISVKLMFGFLLGALMTIIVGIAGLIGLQSMIGASGDLYTGASPLAELANARENFQTTRGIMWEVVIHTGDQSELNRAEQELQEEFRYFSDNMNVYRASIVTAEAEALWGNIMQQWNDQVVPYFQRVLALARQGSGTATLLREIHSADAMSDSLTADLDAMFSLRDSHMSSINAANIRLGNVMWIIIIAVIVVALAVAIFLALYISKIISVPIGILSEFMHKAGTTGEVSLREEDEATINKYAQNKGEIGVLVKNTAAFVNHVINISDELEQIADGDLTTEIEHLHADDIMANSVQRTVDNFNNMFAELKQATVQVARGSKQLADGAQSLAQGSTQQAAATEQLSASMSVIEQQTKDNADMAGAAATLAETIKENAEKGSHQMNEMLKAVKEINKAGQDISKVIKVIDDIAFQTNILALNAAVEAARAGQHGKGFAVVAEEVRNLAAKSAQAAKETGALIINSTEKAELGSRIAGETAESFTEIVTGINESNQIVVQIAQSSNNQSTSISEMNLGIDQVAQTARQNSMTVEESAASSEEISEQALMLEKLTEAFKLRDNTGIPELLSSEAAPPSYAATQTASLPIANAPVDFGKY